MRNATNHKAICAYFDVSCTGSKIVFAVRTGTRQFEILYRCRERSAEGRKGGKGGDAAHSPTGPNPSTEHQIHSQDGIICKFEIGRDLG